MSERSHISEELPRLLTGEASRDVVQSAAVHLRTCEDCQQELVSAVVAHASLTSAQRFAPDVVGRPRMLEDTEASVEPATPLPLDLPDLSSMFAQVRDEAGNAPAPTRSRSRRPLFAVAAVAAGALIGGGVVAAATHHSGSSSTTAQAISLSAFDQGTTSATAKVTTSGQMTLDATSLPTLDASKRYEVWLTNGSRTSMKPIGWIGDNGKADLTVPGNLMKTYSDIEVSVQQVNNPSYDYSGTSVLRGAYQD